MVRTVTAAMAAGLLVASCASGIDVARIEPGGGTVRGVPYVLPMTAFKITITRKVTKCGLTLEGDIDLKVDSSVQPDPDQMYALSSDGWWSRSALKGAYGVNGVSTGLNASSEGQGGVIISNVVNAFVAIAPILSAVSGPTGNTPPNACTPAAIDALVQISGADGSGGLAAEVKTKTAELAALTSTLTQVIALGPVVSAADRQNVRSLIDRVNLKKDELAASQRRLDQQQKRITDVQVIEWPLAGADRNTSYALAPETFVKWASARDTSGSNPNAPIPRDLAAFEVFLSLDALQAPKPAEAASANGGTGMVSQVDGVPVRFARTGVLRACRSNACGTSSGVQILREQYPVLQLGQVFLLDPPQGAFRSSTIGITLDAVGNPTAIDAATTVATGEALSGLASRTATSLAGLPASLNAADLARVKAQTDLQLAENALAAAQLQGATDAQTASLRAQTAVANATAAQATAEAAVITARAALTPPAP